MIKLLLASLCFYSVTYAYVPTVESLYRHGSNPDITANGMVVSFSVKKVEASGIVAQEDFYKIFFTKVNQDVMKVAQTRYNSNSFSETSLVEKIYFPNFSAYTINAEAENAPKGLFQGALRSMLFNDGHFLINYLKTLGVPVKLNNEIINREKVEYLANYKQYLLTINKDRTARKTEVNPLKPDDAVAREKAEMVMNQPMYVDQKQVKLSRENGNIAWLITAGTFESVVSYKDRDILKIKYKSQLGDYEFNYKDYWLANGTHSLPRYITVKDYKGENYQIEILNLRHYLEREDDLLKRLKKWDSLLKGKPATDFKPNFLL